ncbi:DCC1-like thiol-disulfide oxidoreductase family protein [Flavihumibacter petaseus]|uniref:DUF393 domain-containing protein n=1 Tax=Flavihumibacter petaseus NBRC 106054 TaxID=1220578 RepID=A0A0E9N0U6_9BACT|nr:DCC1-like thiol-disulfide oxidoreductase family protein [Flavihumibacter petaseus]GAO42985.1 hypothetical protein FPE01S_02_00900 [Flavihumibacter petaseus NBRC 106054]
MKTLRHHVILYDAECPLCRVYTSAFVHSGMLDAGGRKPYQDQQAIAACPLLDRQRAVNEIALIDTRTGQVTYGIDSLLKVICTAFPALRILLSPRPIVWFLKKAYAFVSYNRRVIIPGAAATVNGKKPDLSEVGLQPGFRLHYRIAFLLFAWLLTAFILSRYAIFMKPLVPPGPWYREYLLCGAQMLFQGTLLLSLGNINRTRHCFWNYLGNLMTVSFAGALALLLPLLIGVVLNAKPAFFLVSFLLVAAALFAEHLRRTRLLHLPALLSCGWLLYRLLICIYVLQ